MKKEKKKNHSPYSMGGYKSNVCYIGMSMRVIAIVALLYGGLKGGRAGGVCMKRKEI